jgi:hypothetical protein
LGRTLDKESTAAWNFVSPFLFMQCVPRPGMPRSFFMSHLFNQYLRRIEYAIDKTRDRRQYPATTPREALWGDGAEKKA